MTLYTIDKYTYARRLLNPSASDLDNMILSQNKTFSYLGKDALDMPMVECIYKPEDSEIYGIRWVTKNLTD
jgi:hypothetical protein